MAEASEFAKSLKSPKQWIVVSLMVLFLAAIVLSPMRLSSRSAILAPVPLQDAHVIGIAMFQYANDHDGAYPTGTSSTEVFQKLIDGGYVTDPTRFYQPLLKIPGKTKATSNILKPENVCWDVTVPVDVSSSDLLPVIFSTGYRINYVPGGNALPISPSSEDKPPGIAVHYHGNNAAWLKNDGQIDGIVTNFISPAFDPAGKEYQQLTPDGPLPP
jgi:hypothetical protein